MEAEWYELKYIDNSKSIMARMLSEFVSIQGSKVAKIKLRMPIGTVTVPIWTILGIPVILIIAIIKREIMCEIIIWSMVVEDGDVGVRTKHDDSISLNLVVGSNNLVIRSFNMGVEPNLHILISNGGMLMSNQKIVTSFDGILAPNDGVAIIWGKGSSNECG